MLVQSVVQETENADREHASDDDALVSEYWNAAQRLHWTRLQHQYVVVLRRQVMTPARTQAASTCIYCLLAMATNWVGRATSLLQTQSFCI